MDALVFGAGAVGLGLGSALLEAGARVRLVGRPETVAALRREGLLRTGCLGRAHAPPERLEAAASVGELAPGPADVALVAVKSFDTAEAARALAARSELVGPATRVVSAQNGWGNAELLAEHFPRERLLSARIITGFRRLAASHVEVTVHAESVRVGSLFGAPAGGGEALCTALRKGGLPSETTETIGRDLWAKMLYNGCLNGLGAVAGLPYGALGASAAGRRLLGTLAEETFAVMEAAGWETHWRSASEWLEVLFGALLPATATHESSTLQDLRSGRRTEIEALNGAVVRLGEAHGVAVPVSRTVTELVRTIEAARAEGGGAGAGG